MASPPLFYDRVQETSTTTGTGTYTLAGAVTGFQSFAAVGNTKSCTYCAQEVDANGVPSGGWEVGIGTYTSSGTTLSRDTILASSNANAAVNWAAGTRRIFLTAPAAFMPSPFPIFGVTLPGALAVRVAGSNLATGNTDLYTVPAGRKAVVTNYVAFNPSAGTIAHYPQLKVSGTYYRLKTVNSSTTGTGVGVALAAPLVLVAGDILAMNCATTAGLNCWFTVIEFDAAAPLKTARLLGPATGDNTLYTVPAGKTAAAVSVFGGFSELTQGGPLVVFAADGTNRTIYLNIVNAGGSPASTNKANAALVVTASTTSSRPMFATLGAGDFVNLNVDVGNAAQIAYLTVVEF